MLSFCYDKKYDCHIESKQRVKNLILVERKVPSSFRYESPFTISKCRSSYHIEKKIGHIKMTVGLISKRKAAAFSNDTHLKKYSHKEDGLRKKSQAVIVFLKRNQYLTYIICAEKKQADCRKVSFLEAEAKTTILLKKKERYK